MAKPTNPIFALESSYLTRNLTIRKHPRKYQWPASADPELLGYEYLYEGDDKPLVPIKPIYLPPMTEQEYINLYLTGQLT